jgi:hypothetical protein
VLMKHSAPGPVDQQLPTSTSSSDLRRHRRSASAPISATVVLSCRCLQYLSPKALLAARFHQQGNAGASSLSSGQELIELVEGGADVVIHGRTCP